MQLTCVLWSLRVENAADDNVKREHGIVLYLVLVCVEAIAAVANASAEAAATTVLTHAADVCFVVVCDWWIFLLLVFWLVPFLVVSADFRA